MANALTYVELNPFTQTQEKVDFKWICPYSSRIAEHQAGILNSYGVSIVALLDNGNFNNQLQEHCENIKELNYSFTKITNLHSTLLGIFDGNVRISNAKFDELVYEAIQCYIQARRPQSMKLTFNQLRPGTWRNGKKRKQVSGCGDGTVIATGDISGDNKRFCDLGYELAEHLKKELDYIFDDDFERKFPTMWSILGYFDYYEDFLISNSMCEAFQTMKSLGISYEVKKLNFVRYHQRTLQNMACYREPITLYDSI